MKSRTKAKSRLKSLKESVVVIVVLGFFLNLAFPSLVVINAYAGNFAAISFAACSCVFVVYLIRRAFTDENKNLNS
ncbi:MULTISPECIES: hypothetical protein [Pseudoalteromonas]|uniref:hypothetical protein n=1 Tax=Pseudoalteromonas TaxID=53246 RepID=UPI00110AF43C|nr:MULTISPECIES: hypothetical protein [Pseudoalteromonas]MCG7545375.1 hypothetical protein [Pseudoalteromonas sp. MM17-2]TMO87653.1 hypothetical protein CWC12_10255 [Pseudoalteromonas ruthenica]TMP22270.1 hypothetical protein CWC06_15755 [Pseudoalteromonas ruthenica]